MTDANSKWPCLAPTNALQAPPRRNDGRVILHFDYDCFYAQVVQNRAPSGALIGRCVGVTQKSILATANYEARRRGVKKLMRIAEARRICPDIVLVDGEDLSPFRDVSKQLYRLVRDAVGPTSPVERLGLDEMFVDATALVDANLERILAHPDKFRPRNDLFVMSDGADGPQGFMFDTSSFAGCIVGDKDKGLKAHVAPSKEGCAKMDLRPNTRMRLLLGSHLAAHLRHRLEHDAGYTASAGIATSKLLSKLAGKVNKPANQTTLLSAGWTGDVEASVDTSADTDVEANTVVWQFMDPLPLRSVPGIGFKTSSLLSSYFISSQQDVRKGETDQMAHLGEDGDERRRGGEDATDEDDFSVVTVMDIRTSPGMSPRLLDSILGGNSNEHRHSTASTILASTGNIPTGLRVWQLLHGVDEAPVRGGRDLPSQISIEDTYTGPRQGALRPDAATAVASELHKLATSLLRRMYVDLLEPAPAGEVSSRGTQNVTYSMADGIRSPHSSWLVRPRTLRLTLRPQVPQSSDNKEPGNYFTRMSHSQPLPGFMLSLTSTPKQIVDRLVAGNLVPMFRKLAASVQMGKRTSSGSTSGQSSAAWTVSLLNVCVTNMTPVAGRGGDIAAMFKRQHNGSNNGDSLDNSLGNHDGHQFEYNDDRITAGDNSSEGDANDGDDDGWGVEEDAGESPFERCEKCGRFLPLFAQAAHARYHILGN